MPVVEIHLIEGYDDNTKARLGQALTDAVRQVVPADPDAVTILTHEVAASGYMRGGKPRKPAPALPDPRTIVHDYLAAMERRDLTGAEQFLGAGFHMTFPGGVHMTRLSELVDWAKGRYRSVTKTYDGFDVAGGDTGARVYCFGTLSGEWPDGTAFDGIRFVDRFELQGGLITRQDVWNDLAEVRNG